VTLALLLGAVLAQASLTPSASPTPSPTPVVLYVVRPPDGWQTMPPPSADPGRVDLLSIAFGPTVDGFRTTFNVIRDLLNDPSESIETRAKESATYMKSHNAGAVTASHAAKVCDGNRDGWYLESTGTFGERKLSLVQTLLLDSGYEYVATYSRPAGTPVDASAVHALDTLCPQPGE